jgi:uncharacterized membrane protein YccC
VRSWKTTGSGLVCSLAALLLVLSSSGVQVPHWATITAGFVLSGGFAAMGISAKDFNVTGTATQPKDEATK